MKNVCTDFKAILQNVAYKHCAYNLVSVSIPLDFFENLTVKICPWHDAHKLGSCDDDHFFPQLNAHDDSYAISSQ